MKYGKPEKYNPNNPEHLDSTKYEIIEYESTGRKPESIEITLSFDVDAKRRDFTINAMGIDANGNILDYFDGRKDIKNKLIRTVGNPHDRFAEDYLRMMRAVRFSTRLGFDIQPETKDAIIANAHRITSRSAENIRNELMKMAGQSGDKFASAIKTLDDVGILQIILPEIARLKEFQHHPEGNVWLHTLSALRINKVADPIVNLSILLHDIGKGITYKQVDGKHTYHGHDTAPEVSNLIDDIAKKLKLTNDEKEAVLFVVSNHMKFHSIPVMKTAKILNLIKSKHFETLKAAAYADTAARMGLFKPHEWQEVLDKIAEIEAKWGDVSAQKAGALISGERVMKLTKLKPGKKIGSIIKYVTDEILQHDIHDEQAIDDLIIKASFKVQ